jgi:hypothetical protein
VKKEVKEDVGSKASYRHFSPESEKNFSVKLIECELKEDPWLIFHPHNFLSSSNLSVRDWFLLQPDGGRGSTSLSVD